MMLILICNNLRSRLWAAVEQSPDTSVIHDSHLRFHSTQ
jgi:hypothetical protein